MNNSGGNKSQLSSISSTTDLIDAQLEEHQLCGSKLCPKCGHELEGCKPDWVGLPAGVKFDPTDQELIEHLEAKVEAGNCDNKSHPLIDGFIPTIEGEDGICYTHPEKLPGVTRDGLSRHFFHRPSKAYTTGTRKRRKIQTECDLQGGETRWHKTGKTRPVMVNGQQKGCKKILVLYTNFGKNRKPEKTNWVMHQYHLGQHEEEKEGELVVSKIFYQTQPRQCNWSERSATTTREGSSEPSGRRESGSGSTSSSKELITNTTTHHYNQQHQHQQHYSRDHEQLSVSAGIVGSGGGGVTMSGYATLDHMQHLKASDLCNFVPFRRSFDEVGIGDATTLREATHHGMAAPCDDHDLGQHQHHQHQQHQNLHHAHLMATPQEQQQHHHHHHLHHAMTTSSSAFHISRPSHSISQIISPPPLHHASLILDDDSFHVSRMMLQNHENFQQQQEDEQETEEEQHDKMRARSASGLEEIIMACTSSSSAAPSGPPGIKQESSMANPTDTEWLKYAPFWPDPDNPDHHG